jgi:hypothetical protein
MELGQRVQAAEGARRDGGEGSIHGRGRGAERQVDGDPGEGAGRAGSEGGADGGGVWSCVACTQGRRPPSANLMMNRGPLQSGPQRFTSIRFNPSRIIYTSIRDSDLF